MTNPAVALRMLITYAICIPLAMMVGWLLTNPLDFGTLGFFALVAAVLCAPIFIRWHYPILIFGMQLPAYIFFLKGNPQCWQVVTMLSLGIAIVERTMIRENRFLRAPSFTWVLLFTGAMAVITMELTGGFGLHQLGADVGGGKKYLNVYIGIATFFALISRGIPPERRKMYVALFFLSAAFAFISDVFPFLPAPLNYINLFFPPSSAGAAGDLGKVLSRLGGVANMTTAIMIFMLARYRLREIFSPAHPFRAMIFIMLFALTLMGGFRSTLIGNGIILVLVFFLEGLHRTRALVVLAFCFVVGCLILVPSVRHLPYSFQRTLSFLPLDVDPQARIEAEGSTEWRMRIWRDEWPKVPSYLLLGKGYSLSSDDYSRMGTPTFAFAAQLDASQEGLAISSDFHSGPLSTLICFGLWGCISIAALMVAGFFVLYRNYKYGDADLLAVNTLLLAIHLEHIFHFFFVWGAYDADVQYFARMVGFSVALNWGVCRPRPQPKVTQLLKRTPLPQAA